MAPLLGRSEINLIRLIAQCEKMVASKDEVNNWRIEKVRLNKQKYSIWFLA